MKKIILASHGELSKGMLNSVEMIVGDLAKNIETFSLYPGENPNDYAEKIKNQIGSSQDEYIIICDIKHQYIRPVAFGIYMIFPHI